MKGLKLTAKILNLDMTEKFSRQVAVDALADSSNRVLDLPEMTDLSPVHFLSLRLEDAKGAPAGANFYWLSSKPETLAWDKSNWYVTPTASYADYTALRQLPNVRLKVDARTDRRGQEAVTHVTVENPETYLAFFIRLKVNRNADGPEILPVVWEDNYFSLLPGEKREIDARYQVSKLGSAPPIVEVSGWNVITR